MEILTIVICGWHHYWHFIQKLLSIPLSINTGALQASISPPPLNLCADPLIKCLTMVALCPGSSPVPPSPFRSVCVSLDHRSYKSSITDWKWGENRGHHTKAHKWYSNMSTTVIWIDYSAAAFIFKCFSTRCQTELTDSSVLVTVFIPLVSLIIQVRHSHWHFWSDVGGEESGRKEAEGPHEEDAIILTMWCCIASMTRGNDGWICFFLPSQKLTGEEQHLVHSLYLIILENWKCILLCTPQATTFLNKQVK